MLVSDAPLVTHLDPDDVVSDLKLLGAGKPQGSSSESHPILSLASTSYDAGQAQAPGLDEVQVQNLDDFNAAMNVVNAPEDAQEFVQVWLQLTAPDAEELLPPMDTTTQQEARAAAAQAATAFYVQTVNACRTLSGHQGPTSLSATGGQECDTLNVALSAPDQLFHEVALVQRLAEDRATHLRHLQSLP